MVDANANMKRANGKREKIANEWQSHGKEVEQDEAMNDSVRGNRAFGKRKTLLAERT